MKDSASIFQRPVWVALFAFTAAMAWGWAYPLIKLGFSAFGISSDMTGSKMLFAGIRFAVSGVVVLCVAKATHRKFAVHHPRHWFYVFAFSLLNTTLHYAFFYIGLSHSQGSRAAILNSLGTFVLVLLACLCFKSDRLTLRKLAGCLVGFAGILSLHIGEEGGGSFTFLGDGMIVLNALCSAAAGLMTRGLGKRVDVFVGTGYSLALGGLMLMVCGICMQGTLPCLTARGGIILMLLICISTLGFTLYNKLLSCNPVGRVAIFNSLIPVVGALSSCLCLHEPFYWKYFLAALLATLGIYLINKKH